MSGGEPQDPERGEDEHAANDTDVEEVERGKDAEKGSMSEEVERAAEREADSSEG
jgi:hypothetical protein